MKFRGRGKHLVLGAAMPGTRRARRRVRRATTATSGGGSSSSGSKDKGSVAVLLPDSKSSTRWETVDRPFLKKAFDAAGVKSHDHQR